MFYDISFSDQKIEFKERPSSRIIVAIAWWLLAFATDFQVKVIHLTDGGIRTVFDRGQRTSRILLGKEFSTLVY